MIFLYKCIDLKIMEQIVKSIIVLAGNFMVLKNENS